MAFSADQVWISEGRGANAGGTGSASLTVLGGRMGLVGYTLSTRMGSSVASATAWMSDTSVQCHGGGRESKSISFAASCGGRMGSLTAVLSTDSRWLSVMGASNSASTGSTSVSLSGHGLGLEARSWSGQGGTTSCEQSVWLSDTSTRCRMGSAVYRSWRIVASVGKLTATISNMWSADIVCLSVSTRLNGGASGSVSMTIVGGLFGYAGYTVSLLTGRSSCEQTTWESDTAVQCRTGSWMVRSRIASISVGAHIGSTSSLFSIDQICISDGLAGNSMSTGATSLTIIGARLGLRSYTGKVGWGLTSATGSAWMSDTSIRCLSSSGLEQSRTVLVSSGQTATTMTEMASLACSFLSSVFISNSATTGSSSITLVGSRLGVMTTSSSATRTSLSSCEASKWESDTSVCCLHSFSIFHSRVFVLTSGCVLSSVTHSLSYNVLHLSAVGIYSNAFPYVPPLLTLFGLAFGLSDNSPLARVGQTACESSIWTSQSAILCRIASGIAINDHVTITVGINYNTISRVFIFDSPVISAACPQNCAVSDPVQTTVFGLKFGKFSVSNSLKIGGTPCQISVWISDSTMLCKPGSGYARPKWQLPVVLSLGNAAGFSPSDYSYTMTLVLYIFFSLTVIPTIDICVLSGVHV